MKLFDSTKHINLSGYKPNDLTEDTLAKALETAMVELSRQVLTQLLNREPTEEEQGSVIFWTEKGESYLRFEGVDIGTINMDAESQKLTFTPAAAFK